MVTVALQVQGTTEEGDAFECLGYATCINRFGAQIKIDQPLKPARQFHLTNLDNGAKGDFRIVGILRSTSAGPVEFGVEALGDYPTFWGIEFPPQPKKLSEPRALLECRRCHTVKFLPLSFSEVDVLESGGVLLRPCSACASLTSWGYAMQDSSEEAAAKAESQGHEPSAGGSMVEKEMGDHPAFVQRPISIQTSAGQEDKAQTESLSKKGLSCSSEKVYEVNQEVTLKWANPSTGLQVQARGRILRRHDLGGSKRKIYNIRYESPITVLPAVSSTGIRKFYLAFAAVTAGAAVLTGASVQELAARIFMSDGSVRRIACAGGVLLLVYVAYRIWKSILQREPEAQATFKKRHRITVVLVVAVFGLAIALGAGKGIHQHTGRLEVQGFLRDLTLSETVEKNIDAAENRVFTSPSDYVDGCATLQLLAAQWKVRLDNVSIDAVHFARQSRWQKPKLAKAMERIQEIINLNRQKLRLIQEQAALRTAARSIPPHEQDAFWLSHFEPLRNQILHLNARKDRLLQSSAGDI